MNLIHRYLIVTMFLFFYVPFMFRVTEGAGLGNNDIKVSYISKRHGKL